MFFNINGTRINLEEVVCYEFRGEEYYRDGGESEERLLIWTKYRVDPLRINCGKEWADKLDVLIASRNKIV